jgi:hypothetical protein
MQHFLHLGRSQRDPQAIRLLPIEARGERAQSAQAEGNGVGAR